MDPLRPRNLLVFVNPFSGIRKSHQIYTLTTFRGHVIDYLMENSLDSYDGVICVGGDGFLAEAVQGLLLRERSKSNLPLFSGHKPGGIELKSTIRLGVIPTGSTDTASYSVHGTNDVITAALHIISGDDMSLDVVSVHADNDGAFIRYVITMLGYGFHADLLLNDDKRRWMGPQRYNYSGFMTLLQHASYYGEISYLPCLNQNNKSSNGTVCYRGCSVCASNLHPHHHQTIDYFPDDYPTNKLNVCHNETDFHVSATSSSLPLRGSSNLSSIPCSLNSNCSSIQGVSNSQTLVISSSSLDSDLGLSISSNIDNRKVHVSHVLDKSLSEQSLDAKSCDITSSKQKRFSDTTLNVSQLLTCSLRNTTNGWHTIRGTFLAVNAFVQSCRCARAVCGPAPWAHLSDGCLDLVLVHKCSKVQFIRFLMRIASNRRMTPEENPFNLPFIDVMKVCAFRFVARGDSKLHLNHSRQHSCCKHISLQITPNVNGNDNPVIEQLSMVNTSHPLRHISVNLKKTTIWCSDGELIQRSSIICFVHRKLLRFFGRGPEHQNYNSDDDSMNSTSTEEKQESYRLLFQSLLDKNDSI
ncbi:Ceramide kinase [Schistosoma japonicum]|nr:Ceramide kinase [Schistosoma japonicum]